MQQVPSWDHYDIAKGRCNTINIILMEFKLQLSWYSVYFILDGIIYYDVRPKWMSHRLFKNGV